MTLEVAEGETLALVGANGAGKTTLLRAIAGAHRPTGGRVTFDGTDITRAGAYRRVGLGVALVPEGRRLFAEMTVEENLRGRFAGRAAAGTGRRDACWTAFPILQATAEGAARRACRAASSRRLRSAAR